MLRGADGARTLARAQLGALAGPRRSQPTLRTLQRGNMFSALVPSRAEQYVCQQICGEAGAGALRFRRWLRHQAVQMLPEVSVSRST